MIQIISRNSLSQSNYSRPMPYKKCIIDTPTTWFALT